MRVGTLEPSRLAVLGLAAAIAVFLLPLSAVAEMITYSGTVSYQGTHSGDSLYVAVLDTTGGDTDLVAIEVLAVGTPPFSQPYSVEFDNAEVAATLLIASFLDVDGGGLEMLTGADVFGYYAGSAVPTGVSSSTSQSSLDFDLPRAEIHGTVTFAAGQTEASLEVSDDLDCSTEGHRPKVELSTSGAYSIIGVYPGTYCLGADGSTPGGSLKVCFGDATCANPTLVTLGETEVRTGVDFDFSAVATEGATWGAIKSRFP